MLPTIFLASLAVMVVSLSGKLLTWKVIGPLVERNMHFLISFASGVLIIVAWNLSHEIIEETGSISAGLPWIVMGAVFVLVAFKYIPNFHHHHEKDGHSHSNIDANRILASDAVHNIGDGAVIVVSFLASPLIGLASTISIMVHETLQEISEFFVLREAGLSVRSALLWNFVASSTILIGAIGSYYLLESFENLEIPLLGLSIGAYFVVVFNDLIPHSLSSAKEDKHYLKHAIFFVIGLVLMYLLVSFLPHAEH
jgi:zinc and cadmium transporter